MFTLSLRCAKSLILNSFNPPTLTREILLSPYLTDGAASTEKWNDLPTSPAFIERMGWDLVQVGLIPEPASSTQYLACGHL